MISRQMKPYDVLVPIKTVNEYGELIKTWKLYKKIDMAINLISKKFLSENVEYFKCNMQALTYDKTLTDDMKIIDIETNAEYEITFINNFGRMSMLDLRELRADG